MKKIKIPNIFSSILIGETPLKEINIGSTKLTSVYLGNTLLWTYTAKTYQITYTNITGGGFTNPPSVIPEKGSVSIQLSPNSTYTYPTTITSSSVVNATIVSYDSTTGILVINNPTNDVVIKNIAFPHCAKYIINTPSATKGTWVWVIPSSPQTEIYSDLAYTLRLDPDSGYDFPAAVQCTGATAEYDFTKSGEVVIRNATANITLTATCPPKMWDIFDDVTNGDIEQKANLL